jgi:hypothetical protein
VKVLSPEQRYPVLCMLAHSLYNDLAVMLGECGLLDDKGSGPETGDRVKAIRAAAVRAAERIAKHQRRFDETLRKAGLKVR